MSPQSPCPYLGRRAPLGHSLLEVLFVLALMGVLLALAAPTWAGMQQRWAVRDLANRYTAALHEARWLAIRSGQTTTVCPSSDGQHCTASGLEQGWIVLQGPPATATVVQDGPPSAVAGINTHYGHRTLPMAFAPNGLVDGTGLRQINLCVRGQPNASIGLVINQAGRTRWDQAQGCP
jgi:type IV fimbrial biogenesis protein FimT